MNNLILQLEQQKSTLKNQPQQQSRIVLTMRNLAEMGAVLSQKRKQLGVEYQTISLQTGVSVSTLKRLFLDPSQVKFATVILVADALGVKLCIEN